MNPLGTTAAGVGKVETTDGVLVLVFIGREFNPLADDGLLPAHLILSGLWFTKLTFICVNMINQIVRARYELRAK